MHAIRVIVCIVTLDRFKWHMRDYDSPIDMQFPELHFCIQNNLTFFFKL